jgi:hypothetical protein
LTERTSSSAAASGSRTAGGQSVEASGCRTIASAKASFISRAMAIPLRHPPNRRAGPDVDSTWPLMPAASMELSRELPIFGQKLEAD